MAIEFINGTTDKPIAADELKQILRGDENLEGRLYIGYPISKTSTGSHFIDALWVSAKKGVVAFDLVESPEINDVEMRQEDAANKIEIRLRSESALVRKRNLQIPIHTVTFAPRVNQLTENGEDEYSVANNQSIVPILQEFTWENTATTLFQKALSVLDTVSKIRATTVARHPKRDDSRGAKLKKIEDSIATLDQRQSKAVMETLPGIQRIRGLAGSGKTVVLALKAAYLHMLNPDWKIAVTFNTRSLKSFYQRRIRDFHFDKTAEEPDWDNLRVVNSWGAPGGPERDGVYHDFCRRNDTAYLDFSSARTKYGTSDVFKSVCREALAGTSAPTEVYDAVLVDEAQDLPIEFLQMCYASLKQPKRLVYAYDELQNLAGESLPAPQDIFGEQMYSAPLEPLGGNGSKAERDLVLETCYRNPRQILVTAHALGFGIYRKTPVGSSTGLVQMFDHPHLWEAVGYERRGGKLQDGKEVTLVRTSATSPSFLEEHSILEDLIMFKDFENEEEQAMWIAKEIRKNIQDDELRCGDIMVINLDPLTTRYKVGRTRSLLLGMGIQSHLAGVDTDPDVFNTPSTESVTFTGIHRAKGNEAAMVYVMNADDCQPANRDLARIRNRLFTAITRSKAWVRVLGVGHRMREVAKEYENLRGSDFVLRFRYPTQDERQQLRTIHRDMTLEERKWIENRNQSLSELIDDLGSGKIEISDLDEAALRKLEQLLKQQKQG